MVVFTDCPPNITTLLDEIFEIFWRNSLINSHVLSQDDINSWSIYTYLPYQTDCFKLSHAKIATFTRFNFSASLDLSIEQLYPQKLKHFNKCPLYAATSVYVPYIILHNTSDGKHNFMGIEASTVNEIAKRLNFIVIYVLPKIQTAEVVFDNGTSIGGSNMVDNNFIIK